MRNWGLRVKGEAPTTRRRAECKQSRQAVQQERSVGRWGQAAAQTTAAAGDSRPARRSGGGKVREEQGATGQATHVSNPNQP